MKAVGIKVLKDNLSKYLKMVQAGETVLVTDRNEVVAEIHSPGMSIHPKISRWEVFLNHEERRRGVIRANSRTDKSLDELLQLPRPSVPIDVRSLMDEIRAE